MLMHSSNFIFVLSAVPAVFAASSKISLAGFDFRVVSRPMISGISPEIPSASRVFLAVRTGLFVTQIR